MKETQANQFRHTHITHLPYSLKLSKWSPVHKGSEDLLHSLLAMGLNQELGTAECNTLDLSSCAVWERCTGPMLKEESICMCLHACGMCVCAGVCVCVCVCVCVGVCVRVYEWEIMMPHTHTHTTHTHKHTHRHTHTLIFTHLTTSECPCDAASSRGVAPAVFLWLMSTSIVSSPRPTTGVEEEEQQEAWRMCCLEE